LREERGEGKGERKERGRGERERGRGVGRAGWWKKWKEKVGKVINRNFPFLQNICNYRTLDFILKKRKVVRFLCPAGLHTTLTTVDSCGFS
jgi:hypothetical protein